MELSKNHINGFKLNVLLMIGLSLFVLGFIVYVVGTSKAVFKPKHTLYMTLTNSEGLLPGAFVTIAGMKAGVIGNMQLDNVDGEHVVVVELRINRAFEDVITASSVAELKTLGMLGDKYIDITPGNINDPPLSEDSFIMSTYSPDMNALIAHASNTLAYVDTILSDVRMITSGIVGGTSAAGRLLADPVTGENITNAIHSIQNITARLDSGEGNLGMMLQDTLLYTQALNGVRDLNAILEQIYNGEGTIGRLLTDSTLYYQMSSIAARTDTLIHRIHDGGTTGRLLSDEELYEQLVEIIHTLDVLLKDLKENPKRYVRFKLF
jgi:phospholipid/cholesterol/gamma-HCH transport system substrate-binding protein